MKSVIIPSDQPSIYDVLKSLESLNGQAIVRPNDPPSGIAGFLFDIPEEEEINLRSEITDHYLEDNTSVVDQIALKPEEVTVRGLVAEIATVQPPVPSLPSRPLQRLPILPEFSPRPTLSLAQILVKTGTLARILAPGSYQIVGMAQALVMTPGDVTALIASDAAILATSLGYGATTAKAFAVARVLQAANKSRSRPSSQRPGNLNPIPPLTPLVAPALQPEPGSLYGMFLDKGALPTSQSKQSRTFAYFYQLWKGRQLFTVETPWGYFTDMAISSCRASQDDETRFRSTFTLTFKKIRTTGLATITEGQLSDRLLAQAAPTTNNGTAGKTVLDATQKAKVISRLNNAYNFLFGP